MMIVGERERDKKKASNMSRIRVLLLLITVLATPIRHTLLLSKHEQL